MLLTLRVRAQGSLGPAPGTVSGCRGQEVGSCVEGWLSVSKDVTSWDLTVEDNMADGHCAYAVVTIDRNNWPDEEIRSPNACGLGKKTAFQGDVQYSYTRGARVKVCIDINNRPDACTNVHYEYEID